MIRKDGTVKISQIFMVMAFISERKKKNGLLERTYFNQEVIIANYEHAYQVYMHELNNMKPTLFYNGDRKKAECSLFVPHIHSDGSLAYWPENGKYLELFKHNNN
jgi:hypothetical protein